MSPISLSSFLSYFYDTAYFFFFFNDTATTEIYTLSLHDALPILRDDRERREGRQGRGVRFPAEAGGPGPSPDNHREGDRKSTRLNSSHGYISYAVFCLKKKKKHIISEGALVQAERIRRDDAERMS